MAGYTFITLDVNTKAPLIAHLKDACGIEADDKSTIAQLQDAILEFEEEIMILNEGDAVNIPAHKKHRVKQTSQEMPTIWVAIFYK